MHSIQQILRQTQPDANCNAFSQKVLLQLARCRTAALGYHQYQCDNADCRKIHYQYHSCRNRHCPSCNWQKQEQWMDARRNELLPVKYFHTVFTLPHELNSLVMGNRTILFKLLFDSAAYCLLTLCNDPKWLGATPSITAVLHTWGQQLSFHPHVHCIVSGGGADHNNVWHNLKKSERYGFLFPYKVMEPIYKGYFLKHLGRKILANEVKIPESCNWKQLKSNLYKKQWLVYAKQPMGGVSQVVEYLGRYSHKVAISNYRILNVSQHSVRFKYKDYADKGKMKMMTVSIQEFVRRFEQHILPKGFVKMRHYGILGNYKRKERINRILASMKLPLHPPTVIIPSAIRMLEKYGVDITLCPHCKKGHLLLMAVVLPRNKGSPENAKNFNNGRFFYA